MLRNILLVGLGGALGSMMRYGAGLVIGYRAFPLATLIINIAGSFLIGIVTAYSLKNGFFANNFKLFLATGICGGFTTFSAFSLENLQLFETEKPGLLLLYVALSVVLGIGAAWFGFKIINSFTH